MRALRSSWLRVSSQPVTSPMLRPTVGIQSCQSASASGFFLHGCGKLLHLIKNFTEKQLTMEGGREHSPAPIEWEQFECIPSSKHNFKQLLLQTVQCEPLNCEGFTILKRLHHPFKPDTKTLLQKKARRVIVKTQKLFKRNGFPLLRRFIKRNTHKGA